MRSVFYYPYERPRILHPIKSIRCFAMGLKRSLQRVRKGYCDIDLFMISNWFLNIIPKMLEETKKKHLGVSTQFIMENSEAFGIKSLDEYIALSEEERSKIDDAATKKWEETLSDIIFLMREANEDTCSRQNPYAKEYEQVYKEFESKYGEFGEKLLTEEEKALIKKTGEQKAYFPSNLAEYREISLRYFKAEDELEVYREGCAKEALKLFSKWFYSF